MRDEGQGSYGPGKGGIVDLRDVCEAWGNSNNLIVLSRTH